MMRASHGQCNCSHATVEAVVATGRPSFTKHDYASDTTLSNAATLNRFGLPRDFARLETLVLLETCYNCSTLLWDPGVTDIREERIFILHFYMERYGGGGRHLHAREIVKMALKAILLSNAKPTRAKFSASSILIEHPHIRQDNTRPGDIYTLGRNGHKKDMVMGVVIISTMTISCLLPLIKSSD
jgi:hypothetical protein